MSGCIRLTNTEMVSTWKKRRWPIFSARRNWRKQFNSVRIYGLLRRVQWEGLQLILVGFLSLSHCHARRWGPRSRCVNVHLVTRRVTHVFPPCKHDTSAAAPSLGPKSTYSDGNLLGFSQPAFPKIPRRYIKLDPECSFVNSHLLHDLLWHYYPTLHRYALIYVLDVFHGTVA
jgi:hypothetical protein